MRARAGRSRRLVFRTFAALAGLVLVTGCASGGTSSSPSARRNRDLILMDEIQRASAGNAFDLVQTLRPNWLHTRGEHSIADGSQGIDVLIVYLDNARLGGAQTLRQIPVQTLTSIQYFDAKSATYKWGNGHTHGAILVSTAPVR